ncbi:cGMP-dependent protein kinase 1-like [Grus japonensis]|uniref:cGMP-dependent protein kinase 1-like n=1 Tax=Grus japonensis TaxID=30415 RepID=A0ABC9WIV5_GRUJA
MDARLQELREETTFLRDVAREEATEPPCSQWDSHAPAIVPEPLASDAAVRVPNSPTSHRDLGLIAEAVGRSEFLRRLGEGCPEALAQSFTPVRHGPGDTVLAEGAEGTAMYIVAEGQLSVSQQGRPLRTLGPGDVFGELALLYHCRRTATVQALGPVRLWAIDRQRYRAIATSNAKRRRDEILSSLRTGWGSPILRQPPAPERLEDLVAVRYEEGQWQGQRIVLGTGGFGRVELVRCQERLFALKRIRKDWVVRRQQQEHVRTERRVLAGSRSPFIVGFFGTFRDGQYVYLLLEFCQGGELWTKLREMRCFEEPLAVFCCACVVEGLEYLHGRGIVYRDLKPENLMLDQRGYVKLVDFGFAKELGRGEKTYSFCGTPEYLAPEMLRQEGHDFAVDFWMLGILAFELLVGSADPQQIYSRILDGVFSFPAFLGEAACSLISKLCRRRPGQRLGNTASGIRGIKKHRWFGALKWRKLVLRQLEAPTLRLIKEGPPYVNFKRFSVDWTPAEDECSGWDEDF